MKDNFSRQADVYAKYRPNYPPELFEFILKQTKNKESAWDCATGNGQSAKVLAKYFKDVFATDISQRQIDHAEQATNIHYSLGSAQKNGFADNSFDLVTVAQALHWFATDDFYNEVKRVGRPGSVVAAWAYSLLYISPGIDDIILNYYRKVIGPYWDAERKYVDDEYKTIEFPFGEIKTPPFKMNYNWTLEDLEGYLNTWSAQQKFVSANGYNPVPQLIDAIKPHWQEKQMQVTFPIHLRIGVVEK